MGDTLLALTLWPEWAWAIHFLDKRIENRGWPIPGGSWHALHAGKNIGGTGSRWARTQAQRAVLAMANAAGWETHWISPHPPALNRYPEGRWGQQQYNDGPAVLDIDAITTSAILGLFRVTAHLRSSRDPWHVPGQIGNRFEYRPLPASIPCKGAQGLWTVPADVAREVGVANGR